MLGEHAAVRQAVVAVREDAPGDKRLIAYVVPADASFPGPKAPRALLRERLPEYMRPSAYVALERSPLTPNGKVDRRALPAPSPSNEADRRSYSAPRDEVEQTLCRIWEGMLGAERVGLDDNFFELGGHSLLAASLSSRLDRAFGHSLPLAALLEAPTVRGLARLYRDGAEPAVSSALVPITSTGRDIKRHPYLLLVYAHTDEWLIRVTTVPFTDRGPAGADNSQVLFASFPRLEGTGSRRDLHSMDSFCRSCWSC